jgi:hypothetical protein
MASNNDKIEKILQSLDGAGKLQAPDFLYTRLQARMEKELVQQPNSFFLFRPAFLATCLVVVIAFNIITLVSNKKETPGVSNGAATIENFAKEYNLGATEQLYE